MVTFIITLAVLIVLFFVLVIASDGHPYRYYASWLYSFSKKRDIYYYEVVNSRACRTARDDFYRLFGLGVELTLTNYVNATTTDYLGLYQLTRFEKFHRLIYNNELYSRMISGRERTEENLEKLFADLRTLR